MSKFYIADLHLGHENVIKHDGRPFADSAEMHAVLVRNWNSAVAHDDEVYILGDFAWKNAEGLEALGELKGKKFLILGNHDKPTEKMRSYFGWIKEQAVIRDGNDEVILCHYPIAHWYNQYRGAVHLYGHVHNNADYRAFERYADICRGMGIPFECCNVGCMLDFMGYTPRTLAEIREIVIMDYKKFHRANAVIELIGSLAAALWSIANLFLADSYAFAAYMPIILAFIIKSVRIITLTGREEYQQESYAESQKSSYADNRRIVIFSTIFSCAALVLIIVKMIIR